MKTGRFGLPVKVEFCKMCSLSNQRPITSVEFKNSTKSKKKTINFQDGICDACRYSVTKKKINWEEREKELLDLLDRFRRNDGRFDVIVPGSGGKDSLMTAHLLKYKYNMNPLTVTWPPILHTGIGRRNFEAWLQTGFANYSYHPNQKVHRLLTKLAFENLLHPFQPFTIGQKNVAPKIAMQLDIPLIFYGEHEAEYGSNIKDTQSSQRNINSFAGEVDVEKIFLGGVLVKQLMEEHNFRVSDFEAYLPADIEQVRKTGLEFHYLGYFVKWHPQEIYYYAVENSDFMPNDHRTEGGYSKYSSLDDQIDWLHYYARFVKFGEGRATNDSAQEIRNGNITRNEAIRLIRRFDGEFPEMYLRNCLKYMQLSRDRFDEIIDSYRPDHLWEKTSSGWIQKNPIWKGMDL
ncbi:N-acetyl sugar amidotransferase [Akkermansiaceae bacterium]|nr:N-acetyl sugar amidotransferase [Akkermansiaceae bacterium]